MKEKFVLINADAREYIVKRTHEISQIPQEHFNKFISNILTILNDDILIDFQGEKQLLL